MVPVGGSPPPTRKALAMMYDDYGWGWWMMGAAGLVLVLLVVAAVVGVVLAIRPSTNARPDVATGPASLSAGAAGLPRPSAAALEALDLRFARGEVDEETYRRSRDLLMRPPV
jgi:putative membrane protein